MRYAAVEDQADERPAEQKDENAEVRARLQSLGYLSGSVPRKAKYTDEDDPKKLIDVDRLMMGGIGSTIGLVGYCLYLVRRWPAQRAGGTAAGRLQAGMSAQTARPGPHALCATCTPPCLPACCS